MPAQETHDTHNAQDTHEAAICQKEPTPIPGWESEDEQTDFINDKGELYNITKSGEEIIKPNQAPTTPAVKTPTGEATPEAGEAEPVAQKKWLNLRDYVREGFEHEDVIAELKLTGTKTKKGFDKYLTTISRFGWGCVEKENNYGKHRFLEEKSGILTVFNKDPTLNKPKKTPQVRTYFDKPPALKAEIPYEPIDRDNNSKISVSSYITNTHGSKDVRIHLIDKGELTQGGRHKFTMYVYKKPAKGKTIDHLIETRTVFENITREGKTFYTVWVNGGGGLSAEDKAEYEKAKRRRAQRAKKSKK